MSSRSCSLLHFILTDPSWQGKILLQFLSSIYLTRKIVAILDSVVLILVLLKKDKIPTISAEEDESTNIFL